MRYYCAFFLSIAAGLFAEPPAVTNIEGQLTPTSGTLPESLSVEILSDGRAIDRADSGRDGTFSFRQLPAGHYLVRVVTERGDVLRTEYISVGSHTAHVELRVAGIAHNPPPSGSVSLRTLLKPAPKNAQKELQRSRSSFAKGDRQAAVDHLNKALGICADCVEVQNGFGVLAMKLGQFENAASAFTRVVEMDPQSAMAQGNLALALLTLQRWDLAEAPARKAYQLDRGYLAARYALGLVSLARRDCTSEALRHLEAAAEQYPRAYLSAAKMMECRGETDRVISALTDYLARPDSEQREGVARWLRTLKENSR